MSPTRPRGQARDLILAESLRLFASRGVEAVSVRDIAAATGLSNPALFHHFAGKDALALALFTQCYRRLVETLAAAASLGLEDWLRAALVEINRQPEAVLFVLDNLKRFWSELPEALQIENLPRQVLRMIATERAAGRMRADVRPELIATILFGTLGQIARSVHFRDMTIDPDAYAAGLADLVTRGVATP